MRDPRRSFAPLSSALAVAALAALAAPDPALAAPAPAYTAVGTAESYRPALTFSAGETLFVPSLYLAGTVASADAFAVDRDRTNFDPGTAVDLLARAGLTFTSYERLAPLYVGAELELDAFTGVVTDAPSTAGSDMPNTQGHDAAVLRAANATLSYQGLLTLRAGFMTSHWGLGLIANDGAQRWEPGSARFTDPRGGDRVLRTQLIARTPGEDYVAGSLAFDLVEDDDVMRPGDEAFQGVAAVLAQFGDTEAGAYFVARRQESRDGATLNAFVADLYASHRLPLGDGLALTLATELALIFGDTTLGPSADFPTKDVLQLGGVLRVGLDGGHLGGVLDVVYASGDDNLDDGVQGAFRADPNFHVGLVLFPYVMAAQSGRATVTAADPELLGYPPDDLDRLPTRGGVTNTLTLFPRFFARPVSGLEIYGGPLIAFAASAPADPFNTRVSGGEPHNALGGEPGGYLGTELDLGVRHRVILHGSELTVGAELGVLIHGDALRPEGGAQPDVMAAGRFMLGYRL